MRIILFIIVFPCGWNMLIKAQSPAGLSGDSLYELRHLIDGIIRNPSIQTLEDSLESRSHRLNTPYQVNCHVNRMYGGRQLEWSPRQKEYELLVRFHQNTFYRLNTCSIADTIIYASLEPEPTHHPIVLFFDSARMDPLIRNHYAFYGHQPVRDSILAEIGMHEIYAQACFETMSPPYLRLIAESLVDAQDTAVLIQWLCSMNPEKQAYGLEGLIRLKRSGIKIPEQTIRLMKHVSRLKVELYSCRGCVIYTTVRFKSVRANASDYLKGNTW